MDFETKYIPNLGSNILLVCSCLALGLHEIGSSVLVLVARNFGGPVSPAKPDRFLMAGTWPRPQRSHFYLTWAPFGGWTVPVGLLPRPRRRV